MIFRSQCVNDIFWQKTKNLYIFWAFIQTFSPIVDCSKNGHFWDVFLLKTTSLCYQFCYAMGLGWQLVKMLTVSSELFTLFFFLTNCWDFTSLELTARQLRIGLKMSLIPKISALDPPLWWNDRSHMCTFTYSFIDKITNPGKSNWVRVKFSYPMYYRLLGWNHNTFPGFSTVKIPNSSLL